MAAMEDGICSNGFFTLAPGAPSRELRFAFTEIHMAAFPAPEPVLPFLFCNEPEATLFCRKQSFELIRIQCFYLQHLKNQIKGIGLDLRASGKVRAMQIIILSFICKQMNINTKAFLSKNI